jgi:hypothetical protein
LWEVIDGKSYGGGTMFCGVETKMEDGSKKIVVVGDGSDKRWWLERRVDQRRERITDGPCAGMENFL